jgi:large-conductance mechanosensitive channel
VIDPAGGEIIGSPLGQIIGLLIEHILMLLISLKIPIYNGRRLNFILHEQL